jgi:hypothetical protein
MAMIIYAVKIRPNTQIINKKLSTMSKDLFEQPAQEPSAEVTTENNNPILLAVSTMSLEDETKRMFVETFTPFLEKARFWAEKSREIKVEREDQKDLMREAGVARKALKAIRVEVEKTRKRIKEDSVRRGKAIDFVASVVTAAIEPTEDYLEQQEKFVEIQARLRVEQLHRERVIALQPFGYIESTAENLGILTQDQFDAMLSGYEIRQIRAREEAEQAQREQQEREAAAEAERLRLEEENRKLREAAAEQERINAVIRQRTATLINMGFRQTDEEEFVWDNGFGRFVMRFDSLRARTDDNWAHWLLDVTEHIEAAKRLQEATYKEQKRRLDLLSSLGLEWNGVSWKGEEGPVSIEVAWEDVSEIPVEQFEAEFARVKGAAEEAQRIRAERKQREEAAIRAREEALAQERMERHRVEAELAAERKRRAEEEEAELRRKRQMAKASDSEKLAIWVEAVCAAIDTLPPAFIKMEETRNRFSDFVTRAKKGVQGFLADNHEKP